MNPNGIDGKFTLATYPYHAIKVVRHSQNLSMNILKFNCILIKNWAHNFHLLIHLNSPCVHYYSFVENNPHEFKFLKNFIVPPNIWPFDVKRGLYICRPISKNGSSFSILIPTKVSNHLLHNVWEVELVIISLLCIVGNYTMSLFCGVVNSQNPMLGLRSKPSKIDLKNHGLILRLDLLNYCFSWIKFKARSWRKVFDYGQFFQ
jgi:hypothetical protein